MKIFLVSSEEWTSKDGKSEGVSFIGYNAKDKAIKFATSIARAKDLMANVYEGEAEFDLSRAVELNIRTKIFNGKVSYQDADAPREEYAVQAE